MLIPPSPPVSTVLIPEIREMCLYFVIIPQQTGLRRTDCSAANGVTVPAFLRKAHAQSGFKKGVRRMQCDQKPGIRPWGVDSSRHPEIDFGASSKPVSEQRDEAPKHGRIDLLEIGGRRPHLLFVAYSPGNCRPLSDEGMKCEHRRMCKHLCVFLRRLPS